MAQLKEGALVGNMQVPILFALWVIEPILESFGQKLIITEIAGGKHSSNSKHYLGQAVDIRTWSLAAASNVHECGIALQKALGSEYFVLVETDHIHIQFNGLPRN